MYPFLCKFRKRGTYHREAAVFIYKIRVSNGVFRFFDWQMAPQCLSF